MPVLESGTYTPNIVANQGNASAEAVSPWNWQRVGDIVFVSGKLQVSWLGAGSEAFLVELPKAAGELSSVSGVAQTDDPTGTASIPEGGTTSQNEKRLALTVTTIGFPAAQIVGVVFSFAM